MKPSVVFCICLAAAPGFVRGSTEDQMQVTAEPPVSETQIEKQPSAVHREESADGKHVVTIHGIAAAPLKRAEPQNFSLMACQTPRDSVPTDPAITDFKLDREKGTCTIMSSSELGIAELSAAIDESAWLRGDIPSWSELKARDIPRAANFREDCYLAEKMDGEFPAGLAWFHLLKRNSFSAPFLLDGGPDSGRLLLTPTEANGHAQSGYAIRILDHHGRVVWQDTSTAFGDNFRIALGDPDGYGCHELFLNCYTIKGDVRFHIKSTIKQAGAVPPAAAPEPKPEEEKHPNPDSETRPR